MCDHACMCICLVTGAPTQASSSVMFHLASWKHDIFVALLTDVFSRLDGQDVPHLDFYLLFIFLMLVPGVELRPSWCVADTLLTEPSVYPLAFIP